ncbi:MAG: aminomethyl-transferring glycine dehydrogenase subunit GcvPA [Rhodospirillaceae bacterium]|jgi:glycine dehydrogenase subunit 1|nr:aminomethyl-transferring glycine dehydrogenase subunit GcvPA [Rhodospirillaceae bacterium]MBT5243507.1 aminomethyl-transferring glycine dehydrogenase subunit GcvPA [Rhodospirillaceae bacterium]MBT5562095.1 aminomethyl-transferring glycine dehydrogenase subunit GcvPA [Rhodospirillaceae bacterium]MBT6242268.1 aminomethyl-transferring glycine dehydrogenase subunit GcvPA [Rhodospirillaceae bacterium]MBT7136908.1 aminomethyl-transferring glycine dehydrogenase subunit GcvPA [Rhodospirillaceae bact
MRYLPLTDADRSQMLAATGSKSMEDIYCDVPAEALLAKTIDLPPHQGEMEVERAISAMAAKNLNTAEAPSFLGGGAYRHHVPATVDAMIQRGEFLTAYTPYQPEVSQGTLQYLFEFQTQVALMTGMEVANASMYDGATACAEAVSMAGRVSKRKGAVVSGGLHPHYRDTTSTISGIHGMDINLAEANYTGDEDLISLIDDDTACVVVQNPDFFGHVSDLNPLATACHEAGALLIAVVTEVVSMGAITSPGAMGADIVAAEGQSIGNALNYGGPTVGLLAVHNKHLRQMPGRVCGQTTDTDGKRGFVLTLSTREQHIRREKATSNICTNSGLCALAFTVHMTLLGETGFARLAQLNHASAVTLADKLSGIAGVQVINETFFNEFTLRLSGPAAAAVEAMAAKGVLGGIPVSRLYPDNPDMENLLLVAATEVTTGDDMDALVSALSEVL